MPIRQRISPCLWFDDQAEAAVTFYTAIFPNSKIGNIARYGGARVSRLCRVALAAPRNQR
jgi:predicted 3-demethylubiquinone-9 3-methyltransferase (glyoxalase superfamily)